MTKDLEEFGAMVTRKRKARMASVDAMPAPLRDLVNDYGLNVVSTLLQLGVTKPRQIKHVVETILDEFSPTRGSFSSQGIRKDVHTGLPKGEHPPRAIERDAYDENQEHP